MNYEITQQGNTARLKDISDFVKKQVAYRNDPVYGSQGIDVIRTARMERGPQNL